VDPQPSRLHPNIKSYCTALRRTSLIKYITYLCFNKSNSSHCQTLSNILSSVPLVLVFCLVPGELTYGNFRKDNNSRRVAAGSTESTALICYNYGFVGSNATAHTFFRCCWLCLWLFHMVLTATTEICFVTILEFMSIEMYLFCYN
jgi:hypothetical protein